MKVYSGRNLDLVAYPLGGLGAGTLCLSGTGALGGISLRHKPEMYHDPVVFSALAIRPADGGRGDADRPVTARVVEAPVPDPYFFLRKRQDGGDSLGGTGNGLSGSNYGLPRFGTGTFSARFPFATVRLDDPDLPVTAEILGWSPFLPGDENRSGLPVAALEYTFTNTGATPLDLVYYFCSFNFMRRNDEARVRALENGFVLDQPGDSADPSIQGAFCAAVDQAAFVDAAWFRGGWWDPLTMQWNAISRGDFGNRRYSDPEKGGSPGGTLAVPFRLNPGESRTLRLRLSWYVPGSSVRIGKDPEPAEDGASCRCGSCGGAGSAGGHRPWYAGRFDGIDAVARAWAREYDVLLAETRRFADCFFDSTLPEEILDAVSANLCILKSPTLMRQADGRIWGWEGCCDGEGCCFGSCTHVWNYAQALCHLFPRLERSLRVTEFLENQDDDTGHQAFRSPLPIRKNPDHAFHAASDGQLGGILKMYREWRISGDTGWLRRLWPRVRQSLDYCIRQWDPDGEGIVRQPHHNTYDIEFWGPDAMATGFYLGALKAADAMATALGDDGSGYRELYRKGRAFLETVLYNGEYFHQVVQREGLAVSLKTETEKGEIREVLEREGPPYQYGSGCLSDAVVGIWLAERAGLRDLVDEGKLLQTLLSIHRYNFRQDLSAHANPQRPGFAAKHDAGLLLCTWPRGGRPSLPFVYSDEVWTGIEYQVASHLLSRGCLQEGLEIVRGARARYDGTVRNPYNEYECGHWYARALSSYALLEGFTGVRYDRVDRTLVVGRHNARAYRTFLATATGYGTVVVEGDEVRLEVVSGTIEVDRIEWRDDA